ncbi:hypothetical protein B0H11DRAFT_2160949 [Mycena galericulata]|nr:hypothetical protein B0H11DRAFT_2160949 [Mycena galericulata]
MSFLPEDPLEDEELFVWEADPDLEDPAESEHSESDDSDYDPAAEVWSSDEASDSDSEEPEQTKQSGPAIQVQQTARLRANLGEGLAEKVKMVLVLMDGIGINVPIFLDGLSWGDAQCTLDAKIRYERSALLNSEELPGILHRWWKPPRSARSNKSRPKGARAIMQDFAFKCSQDVLEQELEKLAPLFKAPAGEDVTEAELTGTSIPKLIAEVQKIAPNLWRVLMQLARSHRQRERSPKKDPAKIILVVIAIFEYTRSHHRGRLQKLFAIYFKFKGLSAKGFDTLHAIGLTMSNKWTMGTGNRPFWDVLFGLICPHQADELKRLMDRFPWLMSYDNFLLAFKVKTLLGNGTAGTVYIKRSAVPLPPTANRSLQESRAEGLRKPLTALEIAEIAEISESRRRSHTIFVVLKFLLDAPDFDFETYSQRDHSLLQQPPPVHELPCGPEHITLQYLLGTVNIPEASYEDNSRLIVEWLRQLRLGGKRLQKIIGLERLTVDHDNSFERLDWLVVPPGFLHISMAFANSLHKQHLGTSKSRGLGAAFDLLGRTGLQTIKTQGPFFHDLNETLHIIADAQIRELWLEVTNAKTLAELRQKSPEDLHKLAEKIVSDYASSAALVKLRRKPARDEIKEQSVMFLRDVLPYVLFRTAIKQGDVGLIEDMIPQLLFRFIGGNNSKYSIEMLELLQGLHRDWPPEVRDFIRENCWVINNTGRRMGHMPVEEAQEMNIKDIKAAIHVIRSVSSHMETEFKTRVRGWKHTVPKKEADIQGLQKWYRASNTHRFTPNRKIKSKSDSDRPTDTVTAGFVGLQTSETLANWIHGRTVERATHQDWDSEKSNSD